MTDKNSPMGGKEDRYAQTAGQDPFEDEDDPFDEEPDDQMSENMDVSSVRETEGGITVKEQVPMGFQRPSPYIHRRNGVSADRTQIGVEILPETKVLENYAKARMSSKFNEDMWILDLREAALRAGFKNMDLLQKELTEMGYGFFDE